MALSQKLIQFLPPPQYMKLLGVGVDISDTSIKYVQFEPKYSHKTRYFIKEWGSFDVKEGVIERGEVQDVKQLSANLKQVAQKTGSKFVRISLPEERAYIFETEIKKAAKLSEIRSQIEFHLEEHVPLSPEDALFNYSIIKESERGLLVSVVVYAKETVDKYYQASKQAGLIPLSFEVEAQSIARAVLPKENEETYMLVDFGKDRTGVGIVYNGQLLYTSTIDMGGDTLSASLRKKLGELPEKQCTELKNKDGLVPRRSSTDIYEALLNSMASLKDELATQLQYWHGREHIGGPRPIKRIILTGGSANLRGGTEYLTETLGIQTVRGDVWQNVVDKDQVPMISRRYSYGYATAIGLALQELI